MAQRIRDEIVELERSVHRVGRAWEAAEKAQADQDMFIDSAALNLHSFYAGLERLLEFTTYQLEDGPPKGPAWHKDLLRQMSTAVLVHPSSIRYHQPHDLTQLELENRCDSTTVRFLGAVDFGGLWWE
ncbi:MAG: hypothetical protein HND44_14700 [Chloroflexi bacterium]|nr:hypothetical protein [Ardenticatenaceae bacterium]NOG35794.1 hypothetical protein [Chloroflexota bacterium]